MLSLVLFSFVVFSVVVAVVIVVVHVAKKQNKTKKTNRSSFIHFYVAISRVERHDKDNTHL